MANRHRRRADRLVLDAREKRKLAAEEERSREQDPQVFSGRVLDRPGNRDRIAVLEERTGHSVGEINVAEMLKDPAAISLVAGLSKPDRRETTDEGKGNG